MNGVDPSCSAGGAAPVPRTIPRDPRLRVGGTGNAELLHRQGAPDHVIADDEGRRSPDAKSIGEDGVPLDRRILGGVPHVAHKPLAIGADGAGSAQDVSGVEGAGRPQQRSVKQLVEILRP